MVRGKRCILLSGCPCSSEGHGGMRRHWDDYMIVREVEWKVTRIQNE